MLEGKVALVTGASGGIGRAIARAFSEAGATVVEASRRRGEDLSSQSQKKRVDVTDEESVASLFRDIMSEHGKIDILVNSAGVASGSSAVEETSVAEFRKVMDVNVVGSFICSKYAFKHGASRIINIGSISAMAPRPLSAAYTASKFAVQGLTRSLALDGREKGIAVSVVHPGNVQTGLLSPEEVVKRKLEEGFLDADVVADSVLHVAAMPDGANVLEVTVLPTAQPLIGRG
mmetsp:Transcript_25092/g.81129  ORF Transcript_25092/g.81129 Transcript_25092/m.81129 type:complete len:232 (+) Transcript_25092:934-1629(+)